MQKVTRFVTADGSEFDSQDKAKMHELELATLEELKSICQSGYKTGDVQRMLRHILLENVAIRQVLTSYNKRIPKSLKEQNTV